MFQYGAKLLNVKLNKMTEVRSIKLSVEQAKQLYNTNKELRSTILHNFTDEELGIGPVLRDWKDLKFENTVVPSVYGNIDVIPAGTLPIALSVPYAKQAKSMMAFAKLCMLTNDLGDECDVDRNDDNVKFTIRFNNGEIVKDWTRYGWYLLSFKTKSIRDAFLFKHEQLIKEYYMID